MYITNILVDRWSLNFSQDYAMHFYNKYSVVLQ